MYNKTFLLSAKAISLQQDLSCTTRQHVCCQLKQSVFSEIYHAQQNNMSAVSQSNQISTRFIMHSRTICLLSAKAVSFHQDICTTRQRVCCQSCQFSPRFIMHSRTTCLLSAKAVSFHQDISCTTRQHVCCQLKQSVFTTIYQAQHDRSAVSLSSQFSPRFIMHNTTGLLSAKAVSYHEDISCTTRQHVCCQLKQSVFTKIYHAQHDNVSAVS